MKQQQQPEYMQSITLYFEGVIEKAGILLGDTKARPCLVLASDTHPFLCAIIKGDAAVMKDAQRYIERMTAEWIKAGRQNVVNAINVTMSEELKRKIANKDAMPAFSHHQNVPITLQRGKRGEYEDSAAFLSMNFPSQEMLAIGGGQPKIIISRVAESESRIDEILNEMATWVAKRLALSAGA